MNILTQRNAQTLVLDTRQALKIALEAFHALADAINPEMSLYQGVMLLIIATHEGDPLTISEIGNQAAMSASTASHNMAVLADRKREGKPGYGLVLTREDYYNRRKKLVSLTPQGIKIAEEVGRKVANKIARVIKD